MNQHAHVHRQLKPGKPGWVAKDPSIVPSASRDALRQAMTLENYYPPGHKIDREYIDTFGAAESVQSGHWTSNDFNFKKPKADLMVENELPRDTAHNQQERYEWPGDYTDAEHGEQFARVRRQKLYAYGQRAWGSGKLRDVVCGTAAR